MADLRVRPTDEKVTVVIDGREVAARKGELLIAAAERAGTYIPRFCYHPRMSPVGMCRMCLVEVKGPRGFALQPACYVEVTDGQEVLTTSDNVRKAQDGVLEFLLINHPLDCPVCDKGGECPLQDQTMSFGPGESRFIEEKRHFEKPIEIGPLVLLDRERCIQCARCTRFAEEIAGDPLIDFAGRGDELEVAVFEEAPFTSYFSGNTIQICPVGALTAVPYRFRARPWDLEQVESTCTTCSVGCAVAVQSSSNRITRYLGIDSDPVNQSWLCDRGRFGYQAVDSPERLSQPLAQRDGQLVPVAWSEALTLVARGIEEVRRLHGPQSLAVLGGARLANEDAYAWAKLAKGVLGTDNVDCQLGDGLPAELVLGLPRATIDEACGADVVVLLAPDLKEELPVLHLRLRQAALEAGAGGHGPRLVELCQAPSGLTPHSAVSLAHRPGEAAALVAALTAPNPPTGEVAGVAAADVARARELLAGATRVVTVVGRPSLAESAAFPAQAAALLAAARPDARFLPALRRGNVMGALDMGLAPGVLPGRVGLEAGREWYTRAWGGVPAERGLDAHGILGAAAEGRVHALVLLGADPVADFPDRRLAEQALAGVGLIVAVDAFLTESSRKADVVLPAAVYAERPGTTTNLEGRVSRLGQKVVPPGVAWPDWMIAVELAARLGTDLGPASLEEVWAEVEALAPSHRGLTGPLLLSPPARDGVVVPLGGPTQPVPALIDPMADPGIGAVEQHAVKATATVPLAPAGPLRQPPRPDLPVPGALGPPPPSAELSLARLDSYSLRLVSSRTQYDAAVMTQASPALAGLAPGARLSANPYDLDRLGVTTGGQVRAVSARASFVLPVEADPGVPRGAAWLAFHQPDGGAAGLIDASQPVTDVRLETV